jgi:hypothetical protein
MPASNWSHTVSVKMFSWSVINDLCLYLVCTLGGEPSSQVTEWLLQWTGSGPAVETFPLYLTRDVGNPLLASPTQSSLIVGLLIIQNRTFLGC